MSTSSPHSHMQLALDQARMAAAQDEVPVGAIVMVDGAIAGEGYNQNVQSSDPTAHAEILALRRACAYLGNYRIPNAQLFVTLEPCPMCFHALIQARVGRIVIGARDPKGGFSRFFSELIQQSFNHQPEIEWACMEQECSELIVEFFRNKRQRGKRKWMKKTDNRT